MKMEKFEVKQEYKDTEGDPHIKEQTAPNGPRDRLPRRPDVGQSAPKRSSPIPIHIAVAIEYNAETEPAPKNRHHGQRDDCRSDHKNRSRKRNSDHAKCRL